MSNTDTQTVEAIALDKLPPAREAKLIVGGQEWTIRYSPEDGTGYTHLDARNRVAFFNAQPDGDKFIEMLGGILAIGWNDADLWQYVQA